MSDSVRPHRRQPTRHRRPWDSPGKNTGVGCHFLLQCMKVKSESEVAQLCLSLSDPMDHSPPGSSVHGIFQARDPVTAPLINWVPPVRLVLYKDFLWSKLLSLFQAYKILFEFSWGFKLHLVSNVSVTIGDIHLEIFLPDGRVMFWQQGSWPGSHLSISRGPGIKEAPNKHRNNWLMDIWMLEKLFILCFWCIWSNIFAWFKWPSFVTVW